MLMRTFVLVSALSTTALASLATGFNYSCPAQQVLSFVKQDTNEIDLTPISVTLCGEERVCTYSKSPACLNKGQYVSGVVEKDGKILHSCCQLSPPVQDHQGDDCHDLLIQATDNGGVSVQGPPQTPNGKKPPSNAGNGASQPVEDVVMEEKSTGPGQPTQLVKSITRLSEKGVRGYKVNVCTPQCGKSTSTTRRSTRSPTTQKPKSAEKRGSPEKSSPPEKPHKKGLFNGQHCFSGDMTVTTPFGPKRMDEIRVGDQVLVMTSDSTPVFEPIEWLYHRDPNAEVDFITVATESQKTLRLSANHLIPFVPCSEGPLKREELEQLANSQSLFARRLKIGHCVAVLIDNEFVPTRVVNIAQEQKRGIYSPITSQGTIVVNDMFVSCYSSVENHLAQRAVHSTLIKARRMMSAFWNSVFDPSLSPEDSNVPLPLKILLKMADFVVPSNVFKGQ